MKTISNLKRGLKEQFIFSSYFRSIFNSIYRKIFFREKREIDSYCNQQGNKQLIGICLSGVYCIEHIKDLLNYLKNSPKIDHLLIGPTKWPIKKWKSELFDFFSTKYNIVYGKGIFAYPWLRNSNVKVFLEFAISTYGCELKCDKIIYTHGMAGLNFSKDLKHIRLLKNYTAIFLNGPLHKKALIIANKIYGGKLPPMYEIGYLRGDRLLKMSESFNKKIFLEQMGLPNISTVLYAPTWGEFSSVKEWLDRVADVCKDIEVNLLVRLHPIMLMGRSRFKTGGINWEEKLSNIAKKTRRVRVIMDHDLDKIMLVSDIMITDVSGMGLEFMVLDKPIVFLPAPRYFQIYGSERPEKWCRPDYEIKNNLELKQELKKASEGKGYKYPADELVYNRGRSLEVMVKAIEEIISDH